MADFIISFFVNFSFIFTAMMLFFAPFAGVFWWRNRAAIAEKRPHFNQFAERFFLSRESDILVLTWAAAEAFIWFIIPEFLLLLLVFMKVRRKVNLVLYDIAGTIIGTLIGIAWHASPEWLLRVPYIYPRMIDQVHSWYDQFGVWGLVFQPFSGVPYKLFTHTAADYSFFIPLFLVIAVIVRMSRYLIIYEISLVLYPLLHRFVYRHYGWVFVIGIAIFTLMLMRVSRVYA